MTCTREDCPYKDTIEDHESRIRENEANKIDMASMRKDVEYIIKILDPLAKAVEELKNRPAALWNILITAIIASGGSLLISTLIK